MHCYRRVTLRDRYQICAFRETKLNVVEIAKKLGFHRSTIYRELKRNSSEQYSPEEAQSYASTRFKQCCRKKRLTDELLASVKEKLSMFWAPEQIAGRFRRENKESVTFETIYRHIRAHRDDPAFKNLRRFHKKKGNPWRKPRTLSWQVSVHERPSVINQRERLGDWERDGMFVKNRRQVLVCVDRKARYTKITKVQEPYSVHITLQAEALLKSTGKLLSITNDNGNEFMDGQYFKVPVYYCDPGKPQQRGTVENTIGLIRQHLPRSTDLNAVSDESIQAIEDQLNHRPRKCLDYKTPYEVFFSQTVALVT